MFGCSLFGGESVQFSSGVDTNAIESTFATLRHRTKRVKGAFSRESALSMMLQLGLEAQKRWHRITGVEKLGQLIEGVQFVDGIAQLAA